MYSGEKQMPSTGRVIILGDVHGDWPQLKRILMLMDPDIVLCVGDLGFLPRSGYDPRAENITTLPSGKKIEFRFADGNHDDHGTLETLSGGFTHQAVELSPGLFYQQRGSVYALPDGRNVLFAGGAKSVDWRVRSRDVNWFPEKECFKESDIPPALPKIDIVISHTAPAVFKLRKCIGLKNPPSWWDLTPDPSAAALDVLLEKTHPALWVCGHWHVGYADSIGDTTLNVLGDIRTPLATTMLEL